MKSFKVQKDVSDVGLGAALAQGHDGAEHVIAYASRLGAPSSGAEKSFSCPKAMSAWSVEKWKQYFKSGFKFERM